MNKDKMKKEIGKMLDQLQEEGEDLRDTMQDTLEEAKEKALQKIKETRRDANDYIENNPEKSVLISVGIGALLGVGLAMFLMSKGKCKNCR